MSEFTETQKRILALLPISTSELVYHFESRQDFSSSFMDLILKGVIKTDIPTGRIVRIK